MGFLDFLFGRKKPAELPPLPAESKFPEELERFRQPPAMPPFSEERLKPLEPTALPEMGPPPESMPLFERKTEAKPSLTIGEPKLGDQLELIISKLETIDARLRYLEERMRNR